MFDFFKATDYEIELPTRKRPDVDYISDIKFKRKHIWNLFQLPLILKEWRQLLVDHLHIPSTSLNLTNKTLKVAGYKEVS